MTTPRRRSFIGMDPMLTDPPAATEPRAPDPVQESAGASPHAVREAPPPPPRATRSAPRDASRRSHGVSLRLQLGRETTERLERLAQDTGRPVEQLVRHLRKSVAREFQALLADDEPPPDRAAPDGGMSDRLYFSFSDHEHATAQAFFDPLGFGDHAMRDGMRPVLARLYRDRLRQMTDRLPREGKQKASPS